MKSTLASLLGAAALTFPINSFSAATRAEVVAQVPRTEEARPLYTANRAPLLPSGLIKLPIGSITPRGWLRHQLELEANGMTGHLPEISKWCQFEGNAWSDPNGQGHSGWEELPYWLKGFGDLGYVLKDEKIIAEARKWIDAVLSSQEADGWFGPRSLKTSLKGNPDLWPHMVMLNVLQSFYEFSKDDRVLPFMTRYFRWLHQQPESTFSNGYWPKLRFGDNIESVYWLYNRTGEPWLLELAKKIHENMGNWTSGVINWHNVNIAQGFREPGVFYVQARDRKFLDAAERNYQEVMTQYGEFPGGGFAGDENCRPGFGDPRQGFETCGIVEFMHSFEMLAKISGDPLWLDRCEYIAFNSFPASLTPDWKALHYLTSANQVQLDKNNKSPAIENGGTMFSYSPFQVYRCCQHNVSHGWPYYAEELWHATSDRGLCASLYSASELNASVSSGTTVRIIEETDYPFSEKINFTLECDQPVSFPLYLRIPEWAGDPTIKVNNRKVSLKSKPLSYAVLERSWQSGDTVSVEFPMHVSTRRWPKNHDAVSVNYGPLTFALRIGEKWTRYGSNEKWPEWEVSPTTAWNYGLALNDSSARSRSGAADASFAILRKKAPLADNPFTPDTTPIEIRAKARKIAAWQPDKFALVGKLQDSPAFSDEPVENVTLIPMGAARLRISAFPLASNSKQAHEWTVPKPLMVHASHVFANDSVEALVDGLEPKSSHDGSIPRFTWWDHRGTSEWVEHGFAKPQKVSSVAVYWFDDHPGGGCRPPASWKLFYRVGESWVAVEDSSGFTTELDKYNRVTFKAVETTGLRIEAQLQPNFSAGILEWKVE